MWSSCRDRAASFLDSLTGSFARHLPCQSGAIRSCRIFERIETLYLLLSLIITAEKATTAFTCMPVASRIAGGTDPVSRIPTIGIVALESCPILDESGSASVAR
jgi:hypothetical protein